MNYRLTKAVPLLQHFKNYGFQAYFVGGCVRDSLLNRQFEDIDIITDALPQQVKQIFDKTIDTGIIHGTITVKYHHEYYEVTTFRTESGYQDFRRPDEVTFVNNIHEDLKRRDFTINAMAMDQSGNIIDDFNGNDDLINRRIMTVGNAKHRFNEDALRMMRAYRFASQLGFKVDTLIRQACQELSHQLNFIAVERIWIELKKMLDGKYLQQAMPQLLESGLIKQLPVFSNLTTNQLLYISQFEVNTIIFMAYYCYLHPQSPQLKKLKPSNKEVKLYYQYANLFHRLSQGEWWQCCYDYQSLDETVIRKLNDILQLNINIEQWLDNRKHLIIKTPDDLALSMKLIIKQMACPPGPWIKILQQQLIYNINCGQLINDKKIIQRWLNDR